MIRQHDMLDDKEQVLRHQLNLAHYWVARQDSDTTQESGVPQQNVTEMPEHWCLTRGIELHPWQLECRDRWLTESGRGVVKVVTGAGKTLMAFAAIERLQNERESDLCVAVVVPTVVLMEQWYAMLLRFGNLPPEAIGRLGGGSKDRFDSSVRILICVLASAFKNLPKLATQISPAPLLLVVDECHKAGAEQMSKVFQTRRTYSLGLSATPERPDTPESPAEEAEDIPLDAETEEIDYRFDETLLGRELGPIIYELDFARAIQMGILPEFEVWHHGLPLSGDEAATYRELSRKIREARQQLQARWRGRGTLVGWARRMARRDSDLGSTARQFVHLTTQRKQLLYHSRNREFATMKLIHRALQERPGARILLFHESIGEVMRLFALLRREGLPAVAEHSQLADSLRRESIALFRDGAASILVSARSLIEGFDVPAADIGLVVASTASVRQRIQTLGRILRKPRDGSDKQAILHVLYNKDTTDELIYEKNDWERFIGTSRNRYFLWNPTLEDEGHAQEGPPRRPLPGERDMELDALQIGQPYPGAFEGGEFTVKTDGGVFDRDGRMAVNPQDMLERMKEVRRQTGGRFRVTRCRRLILVPVRQGEESTIVYAGRLDEPFCFDQAASAAQPSGISQGELHPGEPFPAGWVPGTDYMIKQRSGTLKIAKKVPGGERYARDSAHAEDIERGREAERLIEECVRLRRERGDEFHHIRLTPNLQILYRSDGKVRFLTQLNCPLEFRE